VASQGSARHGDELKKAVRWYKLTKKEAEKEPEIGGNTYPIGPAVDSSLDFQIIKGGYSDSLRKPTG